MRDPHIMTEKRGCLKRQPLKLVSAFRLDAKIMMYVLIEEMMKETQ